MKSMMTVGLVLLGVCAAAQADFTDNFESGDLSHWSLDIYNNWGQVVTWSLVQDGTQAWQGSGGFPVPWGGGGNSVQYVTGFNAADVSVTAKVKTQTIIHPGTWSGLVARYTDASHFYLFMMSGDSVDAENRLVLAKSDNFFAGPWVAIQPLAPDIVLPDNQLGVWNSLRLNVVGDHLTAYFNNTLYFDVHDSSLASGSAGLTNAGGVTRFDDFSLIGDTTITPPATVTPLPRAAILGCIGLTFAGWRLRRETARL
jgi:hypothetical protein